MKRQCSDARNPSRVLRARVGAKQMLLQLVATAADACREAIDRIGRRCVDVEIGSPGKLRFRRLLGDVTRKHAAFFRLYLSEARTFR